MVYWKDSNCWLEGVSTYIVNKLVYMFICQTPVNLSKLTYYQKADAPSNHSVARKAGHWTGRYVMKTKWWRWKNGSAFDIICKSLDISWPVRRALWNSKSAFAKGRWYQKLLESTHKKRENEAWKRKGISLSQANCLTKLGDFITLSLSKNIHSVGNIPAGSVSLITLIG